MPQTLIYEIAGAAEFLEANPALLHKDFLARLTPEIEAELTQVIAQATQNWAKKHRLDRASSTAALRAAA